MTAFQIRKPFKPFTISSAFVWLLFWGLFWVEKAEAQSPLVRNFEQIQYQGTLNGNLPIVMNLTFTEQTASGHYFYTKYQIPITLEGAKQANGTWKIEEKDKSYNTTAFFEGKKVGDKFSGSWRNAAGTKKFAFALTQIKEGIVGFEGYRIKDEKQDSKGGISSLAIEVLYPTSIPTDLPTTLLQKLQDSVIVGQLGAEFLGKDNVAAKLKRLHKGYFEGNTQDDDLDFALNYTDERSMSVIFNQSHILTLDYSGYSYAGGAHGTYGTLYQIWDLKKGKILHAKDIFVAPQNPALRQLLVRQLRKDLALPKEQSLGDYGFFLDKDADLPLPDNMAATGTGILFLYGLYEIAPYVMGTTEIFISYAELKPFMRNDCALWLLANQ
ncbi:DUF3298 and DUF4163 domain-containing protein [Hugenholtzia roseola]|uniref:DUF3298 and DUF4163 domain-containing protein n=1 Tax=Hugenholtzia roseola TaxID=1002 RepID=UPI000408D180|nr:DUF3298 and DUF4163 domain-containing protein [Hugenholtzia roseola]